MMIYYYLQGMEKKKHPFEWAPFFRITQHGGGPFWSDVQPKSWKRTLSSQTPKSFTAGKPPILKKFLQNQLWRWFLSHLGAIQWTIEHMGKLWFSPNRCRWLHLHPVLKWNIHLSRWKLDHLQNFFPAKKNWGRPNDIEKVHRIPILEGNNRISVQHSKFSGAGPPVQLSHQ